MSGERENRKKLALECLQSVPADSWWSIKGHPFLVIELIEKVKESNPAAEVESEFVTMVLAVGGRPSVAGKAILGKRHHCTNCHSECLCTRKSEDAEVDDQGARGIITCCGQKTVYLEPWSIPSSD